MFLMILLLIVSTGCSTKQPMVVYKKVNVPVVCDVVEPHCVIESENRVEKIETLLLCLRDYKVALRHCKGTLSTEDKE